MPAFTKQGYEAVADAMRKLYPQDVDAAHVSDATKLWRALLDEFATVFVADNPAFDARRFTRACYPQDQQHHAAIHNEFTLPTMRRSK